MHINDLVASIEADISSADSRERQARRELDGIISGAQASGRRVLTADEDQRSETLFHDIDVARQARRRHQEKLTRARDVQADEQRIDELSRQRRDTGAALPAYDEVARIGREAREYNPGNDPNGTTFLADVARAQVMGDAAAWSRLARHAQEERVERPQFSERAAGDLTSSGAGGIVVPQYLVDLTGPAVAARRPLADNMTRHPLPAEGMSFVVPTITTASSAALQATQLTAVSSTSMAETDVTVNVQTAAGQQNVSRQAVERSRIDQFVMSDLMARVATVLDSTLINQASTGLSAVALGTLGAFPSTSPTGALLYPKILAAANGVETTLLGQGADLAVMHPRRWYWLAKEMTSTWPFINSQGIPTQAGGTNTNAAYGPNFRGTLPSGLSVIVDGSVPTNVSSTQDEIYLVPRAEAHLWEDSGGGAVMIRADQPNAPSLGVLFVCYQYFAYTFQRMPSGAMQKVAGAGLTTPTF
jgi:HK97 family phage major capsid protein